MRQFRDVLILKSEMMKKKKKNDSGFNDEKERIEMRNKNRYLCLYHSGNTWPP